MAKAKSEGKLAATASTDDASVTWHSPKESPFAIVGLAWFAKEKRYRRLPQHPAHPIRESVDSLANSTAGAQIRFRTDSRRLLLRVRLLAPGSMDHMPATGQCGFDCYLGTAEGPKYLTTTRDHRDVVSYESSVFGFPDAARRDVTLNFPLYQGVEEVQVGLDPDAVVEPPPPYEDDRRVVVYGTSITQGGCASRPGMAHTNILSRWLNLEFINLGFSGNGRGEPELARLMAEIDRPGCFVLDYEANARDTLRDTFEPFIRILRESHAETPILAVSRPRSAGERFHEDALCRRLDNRQYQHDVVRRLQDAGDEGTHFQDGGELFGEDWEECTVDGGHPTDLGFLRMAEGLAPVLRGVLFP